MAYYEHFYLLPNNQAKCILCEEVIENDRLLELHLHGRKHRELYMKSLMTTNNIHIGTSDLFCFICDCAVGIPELTSHVQNSLHLSKLLSIKETIYLDGGLLELPEKVSSHSAVRCTVCDREIDFTIDSVKNHIQSEMHKMAKAMVLQPLNGIFSVQDTDDHLWCKICQIYIDNYVEVLFHHVDESDHAKKLGKLLSMINGQDIDIDNYLQNLKQDKAYCKRCCLEVPCNVDNIQSHVRGKKHKG